MELQEKLKDWQKEGLIDQSTAEQILSYERKQPKAAKLPLLLIIGLIFFSLAVFSFIAANWQAMPAGMKIGLVLLLMWLFYGLAHFAERKNFGWPHIFRLIGLAMFGAAMIVTVQTFHMELSTSLIGWALYIAAIAHYFYWRHLSYAIVAFVFGIQVLFASIGMIGWIEWIFYILITFAWFYFNKSALPAVFSWLLLFGSGMMLWPLAEYDSTLWPIWTLFVLFGLLLIAPTEKEQVLRPFYLIIGGIMLLVYLSIRGSTLLALDDLNLTESILLLLAGLGIAALSYFRFRPLLWVGALGAVGLLLFDDSAIGLAVLAEATAFGYLFFAHRQNEPLAIGFVYFIFVQFVLYFIFAWDRLDMSLFFLIGAILLFAMSAGAWWINRKKAGAGS